MDRVLRKLKGYQRLKRERHLIAYKLRLTDKEYRLWDFLGAICGWDVKYADQYKRIEITLKEISNFLGWDESCVSRNINSLSKKGLIERIGRSEYYIKVLPEREVKEGVVSEQPKIALLQETFAPPQRNVAVEQEIRGYIDKSVLSSFKGNVSLRSSVEYLEIWKGMGCPSGFDVSDMAFIDQVIFEETGIKPLYE